MASKPSDIIPDTRVYDARAHHSRVLALYNVYPIKDEAAAEEHAANITRRALRDSGKKAGDFSEDFVAALETTVQMLLELNQFVYETPPTPSVRSILNEEQYLLSEERLNAATETLANLFAVLLQVFPHESLFWTEAGDDAGVPLISLVPEPSRLVDGLCRGFAQCKLPNGDETRFVFPHTARHIIDNILFTNGLTHETVGKSRRTLKFPTDFALGPVEYVDRFLRETPFQLLLKIGIAVEEPKMPAIPDALKFEHTWCLAAPGAGKTTLILREIVENLKRDNPPAMVILDPKGTITPQLSRLAVFDPENGRHKERLIIVDPTDVTAPPAINMFHPGDNNRARMYSEAQRRQVENQTIDLFTFVFQSRGQKLTPQQSTAFNYLVRLMFSIDGANIHTFLDVINDQLYDKQPSVDKSPWRAFVGRQQPIAQRWFKDQYYTHLVETRKGISTRLYGILERPELEAMFSAKERKLDMFDALQTGKTVLINVPKILLGTEGMELFGRYIIALTLSAAFERITIPDRAKWHPALLYIDEFQEFADTEKSAELLQLAREFKLGVFAAHQDISSQLSEALKSALATNTSIKYASTLGSIDAAFMAKEMRCDPEFFKRTEHTDTHGRFACYVRGLTSSAMLVEFPFRAIEAEPRMPTAHYERLLERNRALLTEPREDRLLFTSPVPEKAQAEILRQPTTEPEAEPRAAKPATPAANDPGEPADSW